MVEGALSGGARSPGDELKALTASVMADPEQRAASLAFSTTVGTNGSRKASWENDVANFAAIDSLELDRVPCRVLLIHGKRTPTWRSTWPTRPATLPEDQLVVMNMARISRSTPDPNAADIQEKARAFLAANS